MMAFHQRISQYRTPKRIDFDDPSTTKPPSLAKSAVLAALEEEEREKSRGTGRQSRSRQPAARPVPMTPATPCIDRETVLKINRRSVQRRHRSCENVWPPRLPGGQQGSGEGHHHQDHHRRQPSPTSWGGWEPAIPEQDFAIGGGRRYGSHDSVYFDERIRRQHKIEPLRTLFDRENVVLVDWGHRPPPTGPGCTPEGIVGWVDKNDNHVYGSDQHEDTSAGSKRAAKGSNNDGKSFQDEPNYSEACDKRLAPLGPARFDGDFRSAALDETPRRAESDGEACNHHYNHHRMEVHPPVPPPRRYYLPLDKIEGGELEATIVRLFPDAPLTTGQHRRSVTPSYERKPTSQPPEGRSKSVQGQPMMGRDSRGGLPQDGIESKPPLKLKSGRTTPRTRGPSPIGTLQRHQTVTDVSCTEESTLGERVDTPTTLTSDGFNINSNTVRNLNSDELSAAFETSFALQLHHKPPKRACHPAGSRSPTPLTVGVNFLPHQTGSEQLMPTANYFDKQLPQAPRVNSAAGELDFLPHPPFRPTGDFDALCEVPPADGSDRADHKFDSPTELPATLTRRREEIHNYNEKLITDSTASDSSRRTMTAGAIDPPPHLTAERREARGGHSSALNVANQPNRNWINLNSNQIYHQQRLETTERCALDDRSCQRVSPVLEVGKPMADDTRATTGRDQSDRHPDGDAPPVGVGSERSAGETERTHVAYGRGEPNADGDGHERWITDTATENANDNLQRHFRRGENRPGSSRADYNYDNKSVRTHYRAGASSPSPPPNDGGRLPDDAPVRYVTPSPPPPPFPEPQRRPRARSGSSGSSVKINEIFEFPPPPPFPCDCGEPEGDEPGPQPGVGRCPGVNEFESDRMRADGDTGRDYATSEHPRPVPSRISVASPRTPSQRNVFKSSELSAGDNDVTNADGGHDHPLHRTSPDHAGHPTMYVFRSSADGVNVGVDYFRTNFTDGTSANTACNLGEEQNKYRTVGPVDKSIDAGPGDDGTLWAGVGESRSDTPADTGAYAMALHGEQLQPAFGAPVPLMISFTDGEFIFGPIDERALELERLELLTGDKLPGRPADEATCTCPMTGFDVRERHSDASPFGSPDGQGQLTSPGAGNVAMSNLTPHSTESHTGTPEDGKLISAPGEKPAPDEGKETDADDGDEQKIAPSHPVETTDADAGYERWSRFENGNISPPAGGNCATDTDTGRDGRTAKRLTRGDEIEEIFQQLNQSLKANVTKGASGGSDEKLPDALPSYGAAIGQLVENVPVIDSILDDLLAFSKQLLRKQQLAESERQRVMAKRQPSPPPPPPAKTSPIDTEVNANREPAHLTEINDDNLINLLADGDDAGRKEPDDRGDAVDKSHHNEREDNGGQGSERPGVSIGRENENAKKPMANSDRNSNQRPGFAFEDEPGGATGPTPREDIFSNVAIFNWNPLDVYQQHGLFMIDPRFALADMRATSPSFHPKASPSHPMVEEEVDTRNTTVNDENDSDTRRLHRQPGVSIDRSSDSEIDNPDTGDNFIPTTDVKFPLQHSRLHDKNRFPATNASSVAATDWKMNTCRNYCRPSDDPLTTTSTAVEHDQLDKIVQMNQVLHVFDACHARYPLDGRAGGKVQEENTAPTTATITLQSNCSPPAEGMSSSLV